MANSSVILSSLKKIWDIPTVAGHLQHLLACAAAMHVSREEAGL